MKEDEQRSGFLQYLQQNYEERFYISQIYKYSKFSFIPVEFDEYAVEKQQANKAKIIHEFMTFLLPVVSFGFSVCFHNSYSLSIRYSLLLDQIDSVFLFR